MNIFKKIKKFSKATNSERYFYILRFIKNIYLILLPFFRIFKAPFVPQNERHNLIHDIKERITTKGPKIRFRYYSGFKLFYSCSKQGTGIVNHIMCDRIYEMDTCNSLESSLKGIQNPTFIDIGANIGLISLQMLKRFPKLKIYAFEPSPHQYSLFKKTIQENTLSDKIILSEDAVSDTQSEVSFFIHNEANCSGDGFIDTGRGGDGTSINVKTIPLDIWWKNNEKPHIDLIKIDTEGAELFVLKGAKELIQECSPVIFFEMQEANYKVYRYTWKDIISFFDSINYVIHTEFGEKFESDCAVQLMRNNYNFIAKKNDESYR